MQTPATISAREQRLHRALFHGAKLTLANAEYKRAVSALLDLLLEMDSSAHDVTVKALDISEGTNEHSASQMTRARVIAKEDGIAAGVAEFTFLYESRGVKVTAVKQDGEAIRAGETILTVEGSQAQLLSLERTGLNLLQRMSGIATATQRMQEVVRQSGANAHIIATRKTQWGLLDKRAVHLGGGGTHRLSLADAILIKNNHLAALAESDAKLASEAAAVEVAIERAWRMRNETTFIPAFIEVEVRNAESAMAAARTFKRLQDDAAADFPCLLLLDNMTPEETARIVEQLRQANLWSAVLIESSGGITEANFEAYARSGVDAVSMGALTHSARALDISQKLE